jgi:hypothetical protein
MIFQLDMVLKSMVELSLEDMRQNPWLIDDMLSICISNPYLNQKYGQKHIDACKEWFLNNNIEVYLRPRMDEDRSPCINIVPGPADEKDEMKHMGDASTEVATLLPKQIGKSISYIVKPFTPTGYDMDTGMVYVENSVNLENVRQGMILVNPTTGEGVVIQEVTTNGIMIESNISLNATQLAIVPQYQYYRAAVEHTFFQETSQILCHSHGDPQTVLWLHSIVLYAVLRYRENLFEGLGFTQTSVRNSSLSEDSNYSGPNGEQAFVRSVTVTGMTENTWIKTPHRIIEYINLKEKTQDGMVGGIKILSNEDSPEFIDKTEEIWYTKKDQIP